MKPSSYIFIGLLACALSTGALAQSQASAPKSTTLVTLPGKSSDSALPASFAGWQKVAGSRAATSPGQADPANADLLKEYGFVDSENATYERGDRKLTVKAERFSDTTGAYGAFSFYRQPSMAKEKLCDQGASDGTHVLFYCTNVFLDINLDKVTAMSASELRELAKAIPKVAGNLAEAPKIALYLPAAVRENAKYVAGPIGLDKLDAPLKSSQVDYSLSPEVVIGKVRSVDGIANVALIQYPTPKIAQAQLQKLEQWGKSFKPVEGGMNEFVSKRSGPIIALVMGEIADTGAKALLSDINYDAEITWSEPTFNGAKDNIGNLVYNDMVLAFMIVAFMFVVGIAFGGFRVFMKKFFPGRLVDRPEDIEFIKLDLKE
ncbi:MAG: hypothetical protein JWO13_2209 [Acidobacteriales bacterium]|nr:hypothetical protein [Terriglobales bacterium]